MREILLGISHYNGRDFGMMVFLKYWLYGVCAWRVTLDWYGLTWEV